MTSGPRAAGGLAEPVVADSPCAEPHPDGQLLKRFAASRDEAAFTSLVERYGPLVLGVCRRVLGNSHDADDAFQATFLTLVRRAATLDGRGSVANWLYTVAYRTAVKARTLAARRRLYETRVLDMPAVDPQAEVVWRELAPVLDEELSRLPEKYRAPLVLCCLHGLTHQEAARELGWPAGSMSRRMEKARRILQERLGKRGFAVSGAVLLLALTSQNAQAAVPQALVHSTVTAAQAVSAGKVLAATAVSARVAALMAASGGGLVLAGVRTVLAVLVAAALAVGLGYGSYRLVSGSGDQPTPAFVSTGSSVPNSTGVCGEGNVGPTCMPLASRDLGTAILAVALSGDGRTVAVSRSDGAITLHEAIGLEPQLTLRPEGGRARALAFAPAGGALAAAGEDGTVSLWDLQTARVRFDLKAHAGAISAIAFAPGGAMLATAGIDGVRLWDAATGRERAALSGPRGPVHALAIAPDGRTLAAAGDRAVGLIDLVTGQYRGAVAGHAGSVLGVAFAPDGKLLATGGQDATARLWGGTPWRQRAACAGQGGAVRGLAFAAQGTLLVTSDERATQVWNTGAGSTPALVQLLQGPPGVLDVSRDGNTLVVGGGQTLGVWLLRRPGLAGVE